MVRFGERVAISARAETIPASASMAMTLPASRTSSCVRMPSPGPTSTTVSRGLNAAAATMRASTRASTRKCCPRPFRARRPCRASSRLALVTSSLAGSDKQTPLASRGKRSRVVHLTSTLPNGFPLPDSSDQEILWHPEAATYRCFLPDLTGFIAFCRTGPDLQYHPGAAVPRDIGPRTGIQPRYSGFRVQGTANSPPSTTQAHVRPGPTACQTSEKKRLTSSASRGPPCPESRVRGEYSRTLRTLALTGAGSFTHSG